MSPALTIARAFLQLAPPQPSQAEVQVLKALREGREQQQKRTVVVRLRKPRLATA